MVITNQDYNAICNLLLDTWGMVPGEYEFDKSRMVMLKNYISDCPSWTGDVVYVVHGEICYQDIVVRDSGSKDWRLMYSITESDLTNYEEE